MRIEWDEGKDAENRRKHGLALADAVRLDWAFRVQTEDRRQDYGERRFQVLATMDARVHVCIYTLREDRFRIISLRKANAREERHYDDARR